MEKYDFLKLMGKGKRCWKYVHTQQDFIDLKEFEDLFHRNFREHPKHERYMVPEIIHLIWLGPKEYPETSKKYLESWKGKHPNWKIIIWSDRERRGLTEEVRIVDDALLGGFKKLYDDSDNFGERSDLIRLLVLHEMGGVYVDHDMECRISFSDIHRTYPFYGGLLTPGNPVIHRSAIVRNSIIGARKGNPILMKALKKGEEEWGKIKALYPGNDLNSVKHRVTLRLFRAFHETVLEAIKDPNFEGIIFPAGYFNEIERKFGIFTKEDMMGAWYTEEMTHHEQYLKDRIHRMMKRMHWLIGIFGFSILVLFGLILTLWMKIL